MNRAWVCASMLALTSCASVGGDPLIEVMPLPMRPGACVSAPGSTPVDPGDTELCAALELVRSDAAAYLEAAQRQDRASVGYGLAQVASAISLLAFDMFDAHPDNSTDAVLVGAIAAGARQNIRPERRRDILVNGARSMRCVAQRGAVFIGAMRTAVALRAAATEQARYAAAGRQFAAYLTSTHPAEAAELNAAAAELETAIAEAREIAGYREGSVLQVQEARDRVESAVLTQLRAERPDYDALIAAIRASAAAAPQSPVSQPDAIRNTLYRTEGGGSMPPAAVVADLRSRALALRGASAGPSKPQYDAILGCIGSS